MSGEGFAGNSRAVDEFAVLRLHFGSSAASEPSRFLAKKSSWRLTIKVAWSRSRASGFFCFSSEREGLPPPSRRVRAQQLSWMAAVDMAHERRMDGIADQLARPLRQFLGDVSGHGQHHVLELPKPARAILRRDDQARAIGTVGAAAVPQRALGDGERT